MITLGDGIAGASVDAVDADLLHEYAHQWFGDAVTPTTWTDLWLNEGFADYAQYLYTNGKQGISQADWERGRFQPEYNADLRSRGSGRRASRGPTAPPEQRLHLPGADARADPQAGSGG